MIRSIRQKTLLDSRENFVWDWTRGCASPILWALLNQLLLTALGEKLDCIRLVAVYGGEEDVCPGDSFVDNTTTGVMNDNTTMDPVSVKVKG
jgi:hypothetical protein